MDNDHPVSEPLISAVYISHAVFDFTAIELEKLLERSRGSNRIKGITGLLLYRNGDFMQLIEGPASKVEGLLKALVKDKRHTGMIVLIKKPIEKRQFSEWQMAFRDISNMDMKTMPAYSPFMDWSFNTEGFKTKPDLSHKLLLQFRDRLW